MDHAGAVDQLPLSLAARLAGDGLMIRVPLTQGLFAEIDDDCAFILDHKWQSHRIGKKIYATRSERGADGKKRLVYMHKEIFGDVESGLVVDHRDGNGLNNKKKNLRAATHVVNHRNREGAQVNSKSGVLGVSWHLQRSKWAAYIKVNQRTIYLGLSDTIEGATALRLAGERKYWGIEPQREAAHRIA